MDEYKSRLSAYLSDMIREELEKYVGGYTDEWNDQRKKNAEVLGYKLSGKSDIKEGATEFWQDMFRPGNIPNQYINQLIKKKGELPSKKHIKQIYRDNGNPSSSQLKKAFKQLAKEKYIKKQGSMWKWESGFAWRTGTELESVNEGKINSKFIKYRIYDKISDEINKVEPDDFNLRKFEPLKRKLISFVQREVKRDKKMGTMSVLKQAWKRSDFDDKVFGRSGIIDGWYKKSEKDFPKFLKRNSNLKWKNYNASSLTYGISKPFHKIVDSLLDGINSLVPESKYAFSEFYKRFKK